MATDPEILLLDEPTSALDPIATSRIEDMVFSLKEQVTILMVTHNLGQATRLGDDVIFMAGGRVWEHSPVQRFFSRPHSEEARRFIQGELPWRITF